MKWPQCPWPEDIWTMTDKEYAEAIPDPDLRTAISGFLMRKGWEVLKNQLEKKLKWRDCRWLEIYKFAGDEEEYECRCSLVGEYEICNCCPADK